MKFGNFKSLLLRLKRSETQERQESVKPAQVIPALNESDHQNLRIPPHVSLDISENDSLMTPIEIKRKYSIASFSDLKLNYWAIPKCGNTSVKYILHRAEGRGRGISNQDEVHGWVHDKSLCSFITPKSAEENGFTNFTVLRCPIHRAISMYADFVFKRPKQGVRGAGGEFSVEFNKLRKNPSFGSFLDVLLKFPDEKRDIHFRSQSYFIRSHNVMLLDLMNIATSLPKLHRKLKADVKLHTTTHKHFPSEIELKKLYFLFYADFELWKKSR